RRTTPPPSSPWPMTPSWSRSRWEARHEEDHPGDRLSEGRDQGRDERLRRRRVPRGQPLPRAGPRPAGGRAAHRRVLPGAAGPAAPLAPSTRPRRRRARMREPPPPPEAPARLEAAAAAIREDPGVPIEEQPGFRHPDEAGRVNRAFRSMARSTLRASGREDLDGALSDALRRLARRRLESGLLDTREVEHLLILEIDGRDDWMTYPILTPQPEVAHLLETRAPDDE